MRPIRIAILGLVNGTDAGKTAKDLLRVLLADALGAEAEWERQLADHDPRHPLVVRVRQPRLAAALRRRRARSRSSSCLSAARCARRRAFSCFLSSRSTTAGERTGHTYSRSAGVSGGNSGP